MGSAERDKQMSIAACRRVALCPSPGLVRHDPGWTCQRARYLLPWNRVSKEGTTVAAATKKTSSTSGGPDSLAGSRQRGRGRGRGRGGKADRDRDGRSGSEGRRGRRRGAPARRMDAEEAIERALALATTLGGDGGGDDVDMRLVGQLLADCKDARTEAASEAAWSLYQAAVVAGTAAEFNIRQYNFALGAVQRGAAGEERVRAVWDALVTAAVPPNAVTLSQLAHGLCKGAKDVPSTLAALRECASRGAAVDAYVLNILLNACLREAAAAGPDASSDVKAVVRESALAVWEAGKGIHNERTLTSTIKVLADAGDVDAAVRTFRAAWEDKTPLDVDALATALRIFAVKEPAAVLIGVMNMAQEQRGLEPNTMCANIVLAACSKDGEFSTALTLWRHMLERRTPPPDKASLASVILACGRAGRVDLALDAFAEGKEKGVECDTVTVNVLLEACAKSDAPPGEALGILMDAIESRIPVDALTISSLLTAYYSSQTPTSLANTPGALDQAFAIVELGRFMSVEPTPRVTNALLRVCVAAGDLPRASRTFEETVATQRDGQLPAVDERSIRVLVDGYAAAGDLAGAAGVLRDAECLGVKFGDGTAAALIRACIDAGDVESATRAYESCVNHHGVGPTTRMVNALLVGLARSGSWREAIRLVSDDVIGSETCEADDETVRLFSTAFEIGGEEEQAEVAKQMGMWLTGSDDALIAHLLERDSDEES